MINPTEFDELLNRTTAKVLAGEMTYAEAKSLIRDFVVSMAIREAVRLAIEEVKREGEL